MKAADHSAPSFADRCARREDIELLLLWREGRDTADIAIELASTEPLIERRIHQLLARIRA